jgi:hypothetical protein
LLSSAVLPRNAFNLLFAYSMIESHAFLVSGTWCSPVSSIHVVRLAISLLMSATSLAKPEGGTSIGLPLTMIVLGRMPMA